MKDLLVPYRVSADFATNDRVLHAWEVRMTHGMNAERTYTLSGDSRSETRGHHAHKSVDQIFICLSGMVLIKLFTKDLSTPDYVFELMENEGIYLPTGYWREIVFCEKSLLLVLVDKKFEESDYIRNWNDYQYWLNSLG